MPTPIPGASQPSMTLEFFEEASMQARAADQQILLQPCDLLAICRMARAAAELSPDLMALASYGSQSAVPEIADASRRVQSSLFVQHLTAGYPVLPPLGIKPLKVVDDRERCADCNTPDGEAHADGCPHDGECPECGGKNAHVGPCSRLQ